MRRFSRVEHLAGTRERAVAGVVAEQVVDLLEPVEVADQQAQRVLAAARALQLELEGLLEAAAVEQAGERVGARRVGELQRPSRRPAP